MPGSLRRTNALIRSPLKHRMDVLRFPGSRGLVHGHLRPRTENDCTKPRCVKVEPGCIKDVCFKLELCASCEVTYVNEAGETATRPHIGDLVVVTATFPPETETDKLRMEVRTPGFTIDSDWKFTAASVLTKAGQQIVELAILLPPVKRAGRAAQFPRLAFMPSCHCPANTRLSICISPPLGGKFDIRMLRSRASATKTFALWTAIRTAPRPSPSAVAVTRAL